MDFASNRSFSSTGTPLPLRILVAGDYTPNPDSGAAGTVYQMNQSLKDLGHYVEEIWSADLPRRIRHGNLHYLLELPWTFREAVRNRLLKSRFDVVEFNQPHVHAAAKFLQQSEPATVIVTRSHGHEVRVSRTLKQWGVHEINTKSALRRMASFALERQLHKHWESAYKYCDGFHVSSREDEEFLRSECGIDTSRIGRIPQGIADCFLAPLLTGSETTRRFRRLIYVGQFASVKGPDILGKSVSALLRRFPDITMTWVCSNSHHEAAQRTLARENSDRVAFLNWMPQDQLVKHLDDHGIFLFPSYFEGFGKAPLEAMSRGLCVVASETGGMRDYIQHGQNGLLFPVGNDKAMEEQVMKLLSNPQFAASISKSARETAIQHTWANCAEKLVEFYRSLIARKRSTT